VAVGQTQTVASVEEFTGRGVALKPFSPVHVTGDLDGADWVIGWTRRDRMQLDYVAGADTVMSEQEEDYEVDILGADGEVLRTISVSEPEARYSEAQQITDFGAAQESLTVRIYQISVAVGRGYPVEATL
jgi:hypothetical protein